MQFKLMQCRECKVCKDSCSSPNVTMHFIILCIVCDRRVPWQVETKLSSHPVYNTLQCLVVVFYVYYIVNVYIVYIVYFVYILLQLVALKRENVPPGWRLPPTAEKDFFAVELNPKKRLLDFLFIWHLFIYYKVNVALQQSWNVSLTDKFQQKLPFMSLAVGYVLCRWIGYRLRNVNKIS